MTNYRIYFFENVDDFRRRDLEFTNDGEACSAAWALLKPGKQVQIWQGVRRVAELSAFSASGKDAKVRWVSGSLGKGADIQGQLN